MSRINFYQLLELKINPPESNPQVIESAIKRKQTEWSRLRNHPTKGTLARQYISLLTEIRSVMADNQLREKEARHALDLLKKKLEAKFKRIDSHVKLLGCKGDLSDIEIVKLADFHKVKPQIIQRRVDRWKKKHGSALEVYLSQLLIDKKPDEKTTQKIAAQFDTSPAEVQAVLKKLLEDRSSEVDAYINIQIRKGFMTQKEISSLAQIYSLDQGDVLRLIRCPIKKESESELDNIYQLDSTVEQFINENLKIVEQDSLYSFLGLFPGSTLEALQKKALEKEKEIRKISQKDAFVTASGVLAGQSISIFKTDESRYAYDLSRARSLLKNLSRDLTLAVSNNTVRPEYFHHLLREAVSFGADPDEARQHIFDYCQSKKWKINLPKKKIDFKRYARVALITLSVFLIAGATFWYFYFSKQRLEEAYTRTIAKANQQPTLEAQVRVYERYIENTDQENLKERATKNIESLQNRIIQRDFKIVDQAAEKLYPDKQYEEINDLYSQFLSHHANSAWADKIREKSALIPKLIDERDYQALLDIASDEPEKKAHAGAGYLRRHPDGAHVVPVRKIIKEVEAKYYQNVIIDLQQCEKKQDWHQCISLCSRFIDVYRDSNAALELKEKRDNYQISLQNAAVLEKLMARAGGAEAQPDAIRSVFEAFIRESPNSPAASLVRDKLASINQQLDRQEADRELEKLQAIMKDKNGRFTIKRTDTFHDKKTGLTWTLLDSRLSNGKCMTYDEARQAANRMKLGGYTDWRLPNARELIGLYAGADAFNGSSSAWYWSSDSFKRYSAGWVTLVDVVTPEPQPSVQKKNANTCGWFRAVRP
ncbi:MAG: DUF1566 domain-containing protein [Deltaproteobacteria bacterium]|nr:DUF1566 domain-containing protein [Deltaproteobacteria bacterium]